MQGSLTRPKAGFESDIPASTFPQTSTSVNLAGGALIVAAAKAAWQRPKVAITEGTAKANRVAQAYFRECLASLNYRV